MLPLFSRDKVGYEHSRFPGINGLILPGVSSLRLSVQNLKNVRRDYNLMSNEPSRLEGEIYSCQPRATAYGLQAVLVEYP